MTFDQLRLLPQLSLPAYPVRLRAEGGMAPFAGCQLEIHDDIRRKWVALTPEEWVRQHFCHHLADALAYSPHRMANEVGIRLNGTLRRCDTIVYGNAMEPAMIIEYKAPTIHITQKVFDQIARYNMVLGASYLVVSNGISTYCCRMGGPHGYDFVPQIPAFSMLMQP